ALPIYRVGNVLYMISALAVAVGSWLSAVWILIANSWMQTPRGYELVTKNGQEIVTLVDPLAAYLNPRFAYMYVHMQNAAVESVALFMVGVGAYYVFKHHVAGSSVEEIDFWEATLKIGIVALLITAPLQALHGDFYARHVYETQPQKFAAMEAVWETDAYVPEYIVAFPTSVEDIFNPAAKDIFGIGIPGGASWLASGGDPQATIQGLEEFEGPQPPVAIVFWSFRIMVGLGFWFILLAFWGGYRWWRGELFDDDLLHKAMMLSAPLGIVAVELGWVVTEVGRQPWVVQDVLKTADGVSPGLTGAEATLTLVGFAIVYLGLLTVYSYVIARLIRAGPPSVETPATTDPPNPDAEVAVDD
ncbi:MAG: cytochrome ubiquinol oxidase subunit I, partial [Halobacteriales archaeon]